MEIYPSTMGSVVNIASLDYLDSTSALLLCVCIDVLIFSEVHGDFSLG